MVNKLNDTELYERIIVVLTEVSPKGASPENISPEARLAGDLKIDSVRIVDLVVSLEDAFGISIRDGVIGTLKTVGDLVALVKGQIA